MRPLLKRILVFLARLSSTFHFSFLWYPLYVLALFIIKKTLEGPHLQIWARNSYTSGTLMPPISDLDITIIYDIKKVGPKILKKKIKVCQKMIPLFQEANVYPVHGIKSFCSLMNPWELKRDQGLENYLKQNSFPLPVPSQGKALAFLFRAVEADVKPLLYYPDLRKKRWKNLASILNKKYFMEDPLEDIINLTRELAHSEVDTILLKKFILNGLAFEKNFEKFWPFFPVRYLVYSLEKNFSMEAPHEKYLTSLEQDILEAQIEWEVWGLFGQSLFENPIGSYRAHFDNLLILCLRHFDMQRQSRIRDLLCMCRSTPFVMDLKDE